MMKLLKSVLCIYGVGVIGLSGAFSKPVQPIEPLLFPYQFSELRRDMSENEVRAKLGNPSSLTVPVAESMTAVDETGYCLTYRRVAKSDTAGNDRHRNVDVWYAAFSHEKLKAWGVGLGGVGNQCHYYFEMRSQRR